MAQLTHNRDFVAVLEALGMPKECVEFTLHAKVNDIVTVEAKYFANPDMPGAERILKTMRGRLAVLDENGAELK